MKLTYHNSASVLLEDNNVKVLIDPWFLNGEYFGSWGIYPPYDFKPAEFDDVDFIYISHIHPDHCSPLTLSKLNKKIPVLIHNFNEKFFKNNLERLGFKVIELENNKRTHLKNNFYINIVAADNCNPELCSKFMGCSFVENSYKTTQIDSMSLIYNDNFSILNTNDCPYDLATETLDLVCENHNNIDLLLVGYAGAGPYPQCFILDNKISTGRVCSFLLL